MQFRISFTTMLEKKPEGAESEEEEPTVEDPMEEAGKKVDKHIKRSLRALGFTYQQIAIIAHDISDDLEGFIMLTEGQIERVIAGKAKRAVQDLNYQITTKLMVKIFGLRDWVRDMKWVNVVPTYKTDFDHCKFCNMLDECREQATQIKELVKNTSTLLANHKIAKITNDTDFFEKKEEVVHFLSTVYRVGGIPLAYVL